MTQDEQLNIEPEFEIDLDQVLNKKNQNTEKILEEDVYVVKQIEDSSFKDVYSNDIDLSTDEGKNTFNVFKNMVTLQKFVFIPASAYKKFISGAIDKSELNQIIENTHNKLSLDKPNLIEEVKKSINNDSLNSSDKFSANQAGAEIINKTTSVNGNVGINAKEAVSSKPSDILTVFDIQVLHKINALENYKAKVESTRGKISLKTIIAAGGLFALGTFFNPIGALAIPAAIAIGLYAVTKSLFSRNPEIKNYDKQIYLLKEATSNVILSVDNSHEDKTAVKNFKKRDSLLKSLYDDRIEAEFARLCAKKDVKIDSDIFKTAYKYSEGYKIEHNRTVLKNKK